MQVNESRRLNKNVRLVKKIERMMNKSAVREKRPVGFFEGLSTYLADGFLGCQLSVELWIIRPQKRP